MYLTYALRMKQVGGTLIGATFSPDSFATLRLHGSAPLNTNSDMTAFVGPALTALERRLAVRTDAVFQVELNQNVHHRWRGARNCGEEQFTGVGRPLCRGDVGNHDAFPRLFCRKTLHIAAVFLHAYCQVIDFNKYSLAGMMIAIWKSANL